jgi:hypothetical protein
MSQQSEDAGAGAVMQSTAPQCSVAKTRYETCFNHWYAKKFLQGERGADDCADLFATYHACLKVPCMLRWWFLLSLKSISMQEALSKRGMDIDKLKLDTAAFDRDAKA